MSDARFVLALAGAPASGKTTVAAEVTRATGAARISFGNFIRSRALALNAGTDRGALQQVGAELLDELGARAFCERALAGAGLTTAELPITWDGVRHVQVLDALGELYAPAPVTLVVLAPPEAERRERFAKEASSEGQLVSWEAHESESHLEQLRARALLVCDSPSLETAVAGVLGALGKGR